MYVCMYIQYSVQLMILVFECRTQPVPTSRPLHSMQDRSTRCILIRCFDSIELAYGINTQPKSSLRESTSTVFSKFVRTYTHCKKFGVKITL